MDTFISLTVHEFTDFVLCNESFLFLHAVNSHILICHEMVNISISRQ